MKTITQITYSAITFPYHEQFNEKIIEENKFEKQEKIKAKILVVEDGLINQKVAKLMLEQLGYQADIAENGMKALAMYQDDYQAILMDVGLPDINGIEVCARIRSQECNNHIPIIALTAEGNSIKDTCLSCGMDEFATKPIMMKSLQQILEKFV